MKKDYKFDELSEEVCPLCHKPLKKRIVEQKETRPTCYRCHLAGIDLNSGKSPKFCNKVYRELNR